jgi:hypothetical protein
MTKDVRVNAVPGTQNDDTIDFNSFRLSLDNLNSDTVIQTIISEFIAPVVKLFYPRKAEVIEIRELDEEAENFYGTTAVSTHLKGENIKYIAVTAYDDFVDSLIGKPNVSVDGTGSDLSFYDRILTLCLKQTSLFYGTLDGAGEASTLPMPGDIVWIDYVDRANKRGGIYKGVAERVSLLPASSSGSALGSFDSATGAVGNLMGMAPGNDTVTPPYTEIDDLCEGPVMERGSKFGGGTVETAIIDGCPVSKDIAGFYLTMRDAAERDGVTLQIVSAFRGNDDAIIPEECGGGVKSGQQTLWDQNCGSGVCDPATASVGRSNHQSGIAFDLVTGMPKSQVSNPGSITATYKWLMLNAHKYGFVRGVSSERWHWEYQAGAGSQFMIVARDHSTWDSFFTTGEGAATV